MFGKNLPKVGTYSDIHRFTYVRVQDLFAGADDEDFITGVEVNEPCITGWLQIVVIAQVQRLGLS